MTTTVTVLAGTTVATFAARATGGFLLHITFGLGQQGLATELDLAVLLVVLWLPSLMRQGDDLHLVVCLRTPLN